jgi:hypothetical protein
MCPFMCPRTLGGEPLEALHRSSQMGRAQMGVSEGHLEVRVSEEFPHVGEAGPAHDQVAGRLVPKVMEPEVTKPGLRMGADPGQALVGTEDGTEGGSRNGSGREPARVSAR